MANNLLAASCCDNPKKFTGYTLQRHCEGQLHPKEAFEQDTFTELQRTLGTE
jgi:hypothetical protein